MTKKLNNILLIDDSESDNFIHKRVIQKAGVTENVIVKYSGQDALDFLTTVVEGVYPAPEVIFLDINMPGMNGWEFLEKYEDLAEHLKGGIVICMLTTSVDDRDRDKANKIKLVKTFFNKPLTVETVLSIVDDYHKGL